MREITTHLLRNSETVGTPLAIHAVDIPGSGGACHRYDITGFDTFNNPSRRDPLGFDPSSTRCIILFQNGPLNTDIAQYPNGITHEALLAIVADRLASFQSGPLACDENAVALECVKAALGSLHIRTQDRIMRRVEGTHHA